VVQRLVPGTRVHRIDSRGHGLSAFARRVHQAFAVTTKAGMPVSLTQAFAQVFKVRSSRSAEFIDSPARSRNNRTMSFMTQ